MGTGKPELVDAKLAAEAWGHATAAAEKANQPGVFTALHGFEWTSAPGGKNLHRTVIFRDGLDRVKQVVPYSLDSQGGVEIHGDEAGGSVLAIRNP